MLFSVLMSVYYKEKPEFLYECLSSVTNQTVLPNEIVIVKDGPLTPELENVLDEFIVKSKDLYKIVGLEKNVGLGKALAIGVQECSYELIARMDTDDIARSDRFEKQVHEFKKDKSLDLIGSHIIEFDKNVNDILAKRIVPLSHEDIYKYSKRRNPFNHMTVMYKKQSVLDSGNYRLVHGIGYEDYDLWVRMLMSNCRCKNIDDSLVYARTGKEMFKRRGNKERLRTALYFRKRQYELGFTNYFDYVFSSLSNVFVSLLPNNLRGFVYKSFLRR